MCNYVFIIIFKNQNGLTVTKREEKGCPESSNNQIFENLKHSLLHKMLGVKYVLKLISKLKKPLIGHNCALDILILCNQFFKPLPGNYNYTYVYYRRSIFCWTLIVQKVNNLQLTNLNCLISINGNASSLVLHYYFYPRKQQIFQCFITSLVK